MKGMGKNMEKIELKLCPFCGSEAVIDIIHIMDKVFYTVVCTRCKNGSAACTSESTAVRAWNERILMPEEKPASPDSNSGMQSLNDLLFSSGDPDELEEAVKIMNQATRSLKLSEYKPLKDAAYFASKMVDPEGQLNELEESNKNAYIMGYVDRARSEKKGQ